MNISGTYKTQHGDLTIAQNGKNITATYQEDGVCSGKLTGNKVEGIWKNKKDQGIFEWTFDGNGHFNGKYKSGLEQGPMRGKWAGKLDSLLNAKSGKIHIHFEVIQENGGKVECQFDKDFENLGFILSENKITVDDYHNIIMDKTVLEYCSNYIKNIDSYLMENADLFTLCVIQVNNFDLSYLWKGENNAVNTESLKQFFSNKKDAISPSDFEEIVSEFRQDYLCPLSYVKAF